MQLPEDTNNRVALQSLSAWARSAARHPPSSPPKQRTQKEQRDSGSNTEREKNYQNRVFIYYYFYIKARRAKQRLVILNLGPRNCAAPGSLHPPPRVLRQRRHFIHFCKKTLG